jgi:hypothetical protein
MPDRSKMSANVLQLGEVAVFEALTFNLALNPPFCQTAVLVAQLKYTNKLV